MSGQLYKFIDLSGTCFEAFQDKDTGDGYNDTVGAWLRIGRLFGVGDMMCFRDELLSAGFVWGQDFCVRKQEADNDNNGQ